MLLPLGALQALYTALFICLPIHVSLIPCPKPRPLFHCASPNELKHPKIRLFPFKMISQHYDFVIFMSAWIAVGAGGKWGRNWGFGGDCILTHRPLFVSFSQNNETALLHLIEENCGSIHILGIPPVTEYLIYSPRIHHGDSKSMYSDQNIVESSIPIPLHV